MALSIECKITLLQSIIYFPIVLLMTLLPISIGGWGVREVVFIYVFSLLNLPSTDAVIISIAFGVLLTLFGLIGGLVVLSNKFLNLKHKSCI